MPQVRPKDWRGRWSGSSRRCYCRCRSRDFSRCGCYCWRVGRGRRRKQRYNSGWRRSWGCCQSRRVGCHRRWRRNQSHSRSAGGRRLFGYAIGEVQCNPEDHEPEFIGGLDNSDSSMPIVGGLGIRVCTLVYVLDNSLSGLLCRLVVLGWSCCGGSRRRTSVAEGLHLGPLDNVGTRTAATRFKRSRFSSLNIGHLAAMRRCQVVQIRCARQSLKVRP